ncbi:MAG: RpiB/LacA/LacB family sugar-phosphate isomerase [Tepidanaerobacteraceae bacterium]|nr:RpiB/LacA/LacB family sugar-phosphate isomerase [Tepidanaerobacteraceae bacterium]
MEIAIGSDNLGLELKKKVIDEFSKRGYTFKDFGTYSTDPVDYPDIAYNLAQSISRGEYERGILICGTGIGMAIAANKVKGAYAAVCHDIYSTERSIMSNNVQIMCMGALVIGPSTAISLVDMWLKLKFKESPSVRKIEKIKKIENNSLGVS